MLLRTKEFVPGTALIVLALLLGLCCTGLAQAPGNDNFADATPLYGSSVTFTGTLNNATFEFDPGENPCAGEYGCVPNGSGSVWWSWTATNTTAVLVDIVQAIGEGQALFDVTTGTSTPTVVSVTASPLDTFPHRYCAFTATAGVTYHIRAMGIAESFVLRLTATNAPVVLSPPQTQVAGGNASVVLNVVAGGVLPLKYQWQFQGDILPGETAPALIVHRAGPAQEGAYSVIVSNVSGMVTSSTANLTLTGTNVLPTLTALNVPNTNRFFFTLISEANRLYEIDYAATPTSFVKWPPIWPEDATNWPPQSIGVFSSAPTSTFSVPRDQAQQFFRPSLHPEICVAHLKTIDAAIKLWAVEHKMIKYASVTEADIIPYLKSTEPIACPSGGAVFSDSYTVNTAIEMPLCKKFSSAHHLP